MTLATPAAPALRLMATVFVAVAAGCVQGDPDAVGRASSASSPGAGMPAEVRILLPEADEAPVGSEHPDSRWLVRFEPPPRVISMEESSPAGRFRAAATALSSMERVTKIGGEGGEPGGAEGATAAQGDPAAASVFSEISDVAIGGDRIFILDEQASDVRVFDHAGRWVRTVGRLGEGPEEFRYARVMTWSEGTVYVMDLTAHLKSFRFEGDSAVFLDPVPRPLTEPTGICFVGDRIHVASRPSAGHAIQVFEDGAVIQNLAWWYRTGSGGIDGSFAEVALFCLDKGADSGVVAASRAWPYLVVRFDRDGRLRWVTRLEGLSTYRVRLGERGGTSVIPITDEMHVLGRVSHLPTGLLLVQYQERSTESNLDGIPYLAVPSFLLDPETGEGAYIGDGLPFVLAIREDLVVTREPTLVPAIGVFRVR